jgi:poly-gamma-glutamate synthesis protein (capsule biosynthesis protein)
VIARGSPPVRIAVLAFSHMLPTSFYASPTRPGTNPAGIAEVRADVAAARSQAEVVVVTFHWGEELSPSPSPSQRYLAEAAVEAGADLVVGHHPHVLQGLERRGHALVAYSLGNFLFPSRGQAQRTVILHYTATSEGAARAQLVPCVVDDFRPRLATGSEREQILEHVAALSHPLGLTLGPDGTIALPPRRASVDKASRRP